MYKHLLQLFHLEGIYGRCPSKEQLLQHPKWTADVSEPLARSFPGVRLSAFEAVRECGPEFCAHPLCTHLGFGVAAKHCV